MQVGDLVTLKHAAETTGIVTYCAPNPHNNLTFKVRVAWIHLGNKEQPRYNFELELIKKCKLVI